MASSVKSALLLPGSSFFVSDSTRESGSFPTVCSLQYPNAQFLGQSSVVLDHNNTSNLGLWSPKPANKLALKAQASPLRLSTAMRWWEKASQPNMVEIQSAQELVDSLKNAGERLVIIDFYSPGCGGCRALHPKICQLAESNPDAICLKVNYEDLKKMCHALHIHVLPFFRFYRGSQGRLCSFSCTVSTIKKFKDSLAKYGNGGVVGEGLSYGPAKGLDDSELLKLASIGEISMNPTSLPKSVEHQQDLFLETIRKSSMSPMIVAEDTMEVKEDIPILVA